MESYLKHHTPSTLVGSSVSDPLAVPSGVPQGSVLGPTLPLLPKAITGVTTLSFADDTTIYAVGKDVASIAESLTSALHLTTKWLCDNHLSLNVQKTKAMLIHSIRRENLPLLFVHLLPSYLHSLFTLTSATHGHCTMQASMASVHLPLPRSNFGKKPFSYRGAAIWNSLPTNTHIASTISAFNFIIHPDLLST